MGKSVLSKLLKDLDGDDEKRYRRRSLSITVRAKLLSLIALLTVASSVAFAVVFCVWKIWTFAFGSLNPISAVLISEGDLGSRIYALCAAQALTGAVGMRLKVLWLSDAWVPATRFHDLFENDFTVAELGARTKAGALADLSEWQSWRDAASGAMFWKEGNEWQCRQGTRARNSDYLDQPDWLQQVSIPNGLYVTSRDAGCGIWGRQQHIDSCQVAEEVSKCYRNMQPTEAVLQLQSKLSIENMNATTGVLYQSGPPTELPSPLLSCSSRRGSGRRLMQEGDGAVIQVNKADPSGQEWEMQAMGTAQRMIDVREADPTVNFFLGGALPPGLENITEYFAADKRPKELPYPMEPIRELCAGMEYEGAHLPMFSQQQVKTTWDSLRWPLVTCMRHQLATLLAMSYSKGLLYSFPGGDVDFIEARAQQISSNNFVMREPIGKVSGFCKDPPCNIQIQKLPVVENNS